ncbi:MAG: hypothetical protein OHK0029_43300 [Armatimonadaceae bacterium]
MYDTHASELKPRRQAAAERQREKREQALQSLTGSEKKQLLVTIWRELEPQQEEPHLAAYLRKFTEETNLNVLAVWSEDSEIARKPLPRSIIRKPITVALDMLAEAYKCEWILEDGIIRFRSKADFKKDKPISIIPK